MKFALICVAACGFAFPASAADMPAKMSPSSQMLVDLWKTADTNHDGKVARAEWEAALKARFASFDKNHDGKLSSDEVTNMLAASGAPSSMTTADYIKRVDTDGDGMISEKEYVDRLMARFDAWDLNHDGVLTADEQSAEINRMEASPH